MTPPIVKRFLISLQHNKLLGVFTFLVVVGVAGVVAIQKPDPPTYQATGALSFSPTPPVFTQAGGQIQQQGRKVNEEMLLANRVLEQVFQKTQISDREILQSIRIRFPQAEGGGPQVITISYTDDQGDQAGLVLQTLMEAMVEHSRWVNTFRLRSQIEEIGKRLPGVEKELQTAEEALDRYIRNEGAALLAVQNGTLIQRITTSQQEQEAVELRLEELATQISSLQNRLSLTPDQAYTSSALSADPIIAQLRAQIFQLETDIGNLARDYKPGHPRMIELSQQLGSNEKLLQERAAEVLRSDSQFTSLSQIRADSTLNPATQQLANSLVALEIEQETLLRRLDTLKITEEKLRQEYAAFPNKQFRQDRLAEQVALKRDLFTRMQSALEDAKAAEAETVGSLDIAQTAAVRAQVQEALNPIIVMGAGVGVGFIAATGIIFVLSTLDNKLYGAQEIKSLLPERDVTLLGELPHLPEPENGSEKPPILLGSNLAYLPIYDRFRSNIRRLNDQPKVILITSVGRDEGKTTTAYNLAIASAHSGKRTLLLELDLRSSSVADALDVPPDPHAAIEPLRYYNSRSDSVRLVPEIENLYVVPSPGPQRQAAAIIESSELRRLLEDARRRFDMVVIDTPSITKCNDAFLLEPLTDGLIIVARPGFTQKSLLELVLDEMTEVEEEDISPLLGVVINGVVQPLDISNVDEEEQQIEIKENSRTPEEDFEEETPLPLG